MGKWRKVVQEAYHDELCPKPDEDVMKQVKNHIKEKIKQKRRGTTIKMEKHQYN